MAQENLSDILFQPSTSEPIIITQPAVDQLKKILSEEKTPENHYLRVGVKGGGCSGLSYILDIDEKKEFDEIFDYKAFSLIIDKRHLMYLEGTTLDFSEGLDNRGFTFDNPNAQSTCGCGSSFST